MARHAQAGDQVLALHFTRGGLGARGREPKEVERLRTEEAKVVCRMLGVEPLFFDFPDGSLEVCSATVDAFRTLLAQHPPDLLLAHWPLDTHPDHQAVGVIALRAWVAAGGAFPLHFYEAETGYQSLHFVPNLYVDITKTTSLKRQALMAYVVSGVEHWYPLHERMESFRGIEARVDRAEAFVVAQYRMAT